MFSPMIGDAGGRRIPNPVRMLWVTLVQGSCFLAISFGLQDAPLFWFAALRALIAGAALTIVAALLRRPLPATRSSWGLIVLLGVINVALAFAVMFGGIIGLSTGAASVLANAQPLLILLPAWWLFQERPSRRTVAAMLVGFAGLVLIAIPNGAGAGAWFSLAAAAAVTVGTLLTRALGGDPLVVTAAQFVIGGVLLAAVAALVEGPPTIVWSPRFTVVVLYLALIGTAATSLAWFTEVQHARLDRLAAWTLLVPVFGVGLSVLILGEQQSGWSWLGMAVVVAALLGLTLPLGGRTPRTVPPGVAAVQPQNEGAPRP